MEYKELYNEIRNISNKCDPMGLINIGAPNDEYDPETSRILPLIDKLQTVEELAIGIANIYNEMFDTNFNPNDKCISKMAADIYKFKIKV